MVKKCWSCGEEFETNIERVICCPKKECKKKRMAYTRRQWANGNGVLSKNRSEKQKQKMFKGARKDLPRSRSKEYTCQYLIHGEIPCGEPCLEGNRFLCPKHMRKARRLGYGAGTFGI